jgi:hypothetical protein
VTAKPKATTAKPKKPRAKRGEILDEFDPNWEPLLALARVYVDEFMWMFRVELRGGIRLEAYKHRWSRRYLYLTDDERCFGYRGDSLYREIDVQEDFDWTVGRTEVWWSIPRYTELSDAQSDGLNA